MSWINFSHWDITWASYWWTSSGGDKAWTKLTPVWHRQATGSMPPKNRDNFNDDTLDYAGNPLTSWSPMTENEVRSFQILAAESVARMLAENDSTS